MSDRLSKVEKLRIAGLVAPKVRRGSARKVTVVNKSGEPIREMTLDEVQAALAKRQDIEFSVRDDAPQTVCAGWDGTCKAKPGPHAFTPQAVRTRKGEPWRCHRCASLRRRRRHVAVCAGWDEPCPGAVIAPQHAFAPSRVALRNGEPWRCRACAGKRTNATPAVVAARSTVAEKIAGKARARYASMTPEQRAALSEAGRKSNAKLSAEERSERSRRAAASRSPEERRAAAQIAAARKDPDSVRRAALLASAKSAERSPEERRAAAAKYDSGRRASNSKEMWRSLTPEQRAERLRKMSESHRKSRR